MCGGNSCHRSCQNRASSSIYVFLFCSSFVSFQFHVFFNCVLLCISSLTPLSFYSCISCCSVSLSVSAGQLDIYRKVRVILVCRLTTPCDNRHRTHVTGEDAQENARRNGSTIGATVNDATTTSSTGTCWQVVLRRGVEMGPPETWFAAVFLKCGARASAEASNLGRKSRLSSKQHAVGSYAALHRT